MAGSYLIDRGWVQVNEDTAWNIFAAASFREECVVRSTIAYARRFVDSAVGLEAMLEEITADVRICT